ncbi:MAG: hypothetical protein ACYDAC_09880 [Candidatus Dormibacteria bacterium]
MQRAYLGSAAGFGVAILLAVASVGLVTADPRLANGLMDAAVALAIAVAACLCVLWRLESRGLHGAADPSNDPTAADRSHSGAHLAASVSSHGGDVIVIDAVAPTASSDPDVELTGGRVAPRLHGSRLAGALRGSEPPGMAPWGVVLDPRAYDDDDDPAGAELTSAAPADTPVR